MGVSPRILNICTFKAIYGQLHCVKLVIHMFDLIFDISFVP